MSDLQRKIITLETDLATKDSELVQERQVKEELMGQAFAVAQSQDSERKFLFTFVRFFMFFLTEKVKDEKFNKLKDFYVKLRDDHIAKLREKAEVDKKLANSMKKIEEMELNKGEMEVKVLELQREMSKVQENIQTSADCRNEELESLKRDKELFNMETEVSVKFLANQNYENKQKNNYLASHWLKTKRSVATSQNFKSLARDYYFKSLTNKISRQFSPSHSS